MRTSVTAWRGYLVAVMLVATVVVRGIRSDAVPAEALGVLGAVRIRGHIALARRQRRPTRLGWLAGAANGDTH